jgi:hypothetical protein
MPWFHDFLTSISRPPDTRLHPSLGRRVLAAVLSAALVLGTISPGVALAGEVDSEQEGVAPPGALPGLEEIEPSGEETVLEEVPGAPGVGEETEEGPPLESEPPQEPEPPPLPPEASAAAPPAAEEAASVPAPGPEYEPAAPPPSAPVENQPLSAPESAAAVPPAPEAPAPSSPSEAPEAPAPEPAQPAPAPAPAEPGAGVGTLTGRHLHIVQTGESLWSIATALLPAGADNAEIAAEVQRLWRLNAARIGTGDPNLLYAGTELRLR